MSWRKVMLTGILVCALQAGCGADHDDKQNSVSAVPNVVTQDIQAGIEKHIQEGTRSGKGYFKIPYEGRQLALQLVRVHTEYLANLGPRRHFACVDLAGTEGDVYDVDFFLAGDPGAMTVTETTVHKINGQPLYVWEQWKDKSWHRAPVENAGPSLLGVIKGKDKFEFRYQVTLPEISGPTCLWLPLPATDSFQTVEVKSIKAPTQGRTLKEHRHGNSVLFLQLGPEDSGKSVEMCFAVQRTEKQAYAAPPPSPGQYLEPEQLVPDNEKFRRIAQEVVVGKNGDLARVRALYDHVIDHMRYMKYGSGWGQGNAVYACDAGTGNCSDFHSYFIALCRAAGIPARFAVGAAIPSERNEGGIDGYHCWAEFYIDGKWWPVDISEADKCTGLASYYFGHNPANRIELSRGRDLVLEPGPVSGPINFLAYPVLEIRGQPASVKVSFSFHRNTSG